VRSTEEKRRFDDHHSESGPRKKPKKGRRKGKATGQRTGDTAGKEADARNSDVAEEREQDSVEDYDYAGEAEPQRKLFADDDAELKKVSHEWNAAEWLPEDIATLRASNAFDEKLYE
jgi:hypothetical protein